MALGEALQLRNLIHMPALQAFTTRRFRFPFPFWLGGRWGVSPLPSKVPLVYVMGRPIAPPPLTNPGATATATAPPAECDGNSSGGGKGASAAAEPHPSSAVPQSASAVSQSDVDALHAAYFDSLSDLFRRYRHLHPHFAGADLVYAYD